MYLKRLEIKGFKSFPTKTEIVFNEGITAIVGPNGSGKSNISDAIRWVLGEQSAKSLRGDKLEDVIFVGTESKKAMNYCEVAITLDNSDNKLDLGFSEVTIKRRAYRTGESEFFLNNKSCRLKDIKEILSQTEGKLVVIDNADILLDDDTRKYISLDDKNQYLIIGRNPKNLFATKENLFELVSEKVGEQTMFTIEAYM